ncbi:hypothetical protein O6H91_02G003000 [Diphasiastrum complanatum]|uniref:Uncharacterized protein n=4 Tax=Diphasiastrum complanatum TaxID=34168 RepID=A0ACC2ECA0_DIPCM|nr:hypothetical protein O6H91_02G003000 [Diphasiastrum complanatum]KAJ7564117.1 hypothetical protein O6H91_02G003000 [Diphasiastrum complanatum]KAJ7564118.1 hypothetical protein O6H91_02G003000 [Diphasiastrum complanatum]KAJ7564119.1 hypothetical protein O6H91_02G003000 [Diphasiastrum complanatum]
MGKELPVSPKIHQTDGKKTNLPWIIGTAGLCFFFYILGSLQNSSTVKLESTKVAVVRCNSNSPLDFGAHHTSVGTNDDSYAQDIVLEPCDIKYSEYTPCEDLDRSLKFDRDRLIYRERHCPTKDEKLHCLIPAPPGYKNPFPWPKSRDYAWYANVPHKELTVEKAIQNWIQYEGDKFHFPGGGTMFSNGADTYINNIKALIPLTDGYIRTALDTGCGVASWGAYLLKRDILTMSFAPRDTHEAQVQFALERGVPAIIGVMASQRLPYPARAFDMAHCSRCLIPWKDYDGIYLLEVDRVLRPGGFWILSGPPVNWKAHWKGWQRTQEDLKQEMDAIEDLAARLCWKKVVEKGDLAIWQKPWNHIECVKKHKEVLVPQICKGDDGDKAWYTKMETCITPLPKVKRKKDVAGGKISKWPARATAVPPRILAGTLPGITAESFNADTLLWAERVAYYKSSLITPLAQGRYRNIMDMNSGLGGFAAALASDNVWVMNTVSPDSKDSNLGVIFERGFIGAYQDWCEPFSTYPRTYDLIHANGIFSMYQDRCDIFDILLEMDRILRPEGAVIIRDDLEVLNKIKRMTNGFQWESKLADHESGPFNSEKILVAVKSYWVGAVESKRALDMTTS